MTANAWQPARGQQSSSLPGGATLVTATLPDAASAAIGVWFAVGSRHESPRLNGVAHFLEHLLFKGTRHSSASALSQRIEGLGGYFNAFTEEEHTCFYARAAARHARELLDTLLEMAVEPALAPADIRRERRVIQEEIAMYDDQPAEKAHELLNAAQFPGHPLGRPVAGTRDSLAEIRRTDLVRRLETHYASGALVIAAAGAVNHAEIAEWAGTWVRRLRAGEAPAPDATPSEPDRPRFTALRRKVEQSNLELGFRACSRLDPARHAVRLLNVIFGENMSSRLFQAVRENRGLAYQIQSSATFWSDCGDLAISAGVDPERLESAVRLILREARRLTQSPPGARELARAREYAIGHFDLHLENPENYMVHLGEQWLAFGRVEPPDQWRAALTRVTASEIRAAARAVFQPRRAALAIVGPDRPKSRWAGRWTSGLAGR